MRKPKMQLVELQRVSAGIFSVRNKAKWPYQQQKIKSQWQKLLCLKTFEFSFLKIFRIFVFFS